jgi:hypothetical protein
MSESAYYRSQDDFHGLGSSPNQSGLDLATTHVSDLENQDVAPVTPIIPGNESTLLLLGEVISVSQPTTPCHDHQPDPILPPLEITSSTCFSPSGNNPIGHLLSPCSSLSDLSATPVLDTEDWDIQFKGVEQEAARFGETRNTTPSSQLSSPDSELIPLGNSQSGLIDPWEDELFIPLEDRLSGDSSQADDTSNISAEEPEEISLDFNGPERINLHPSDPVSAAQWIERHILLL